jgi:hypothetical protein
MLLAGCNSSNPGGDFVLAGKPDPMKATGDPATRYTRVPAAVSASAETGAVVQGFCPTVVLRDGTAFHRSFARGSQDDPKQVTYQASLADTTRACSRTDSTLTITAVVQGRLVAGPQGKAGAINLPIRVTVMDGDNEVTSEVVQYPVTMADVGLPTQFVFSREVTVPGNVSGATRVYVGFDEKKKK